MGKNRNTVAKTEIWRILKTSDTALSHAEILAAVDGLCDRVTVYRVLDRLQEEGSIHKVVNMDGIHKFAACHNCSEHHHHNHIHFSCERCKTVTCLENVEPVFNLPEKYRLHQVNFTVSGLCAKCS